MLLFVLTMALVAVVCGEEYKQQAVFYNFHGIPEGPQGEKYVALTFDDGPHRSFDPEINGYIKED